MNDLGLIRYFLDIQDEVKYVDNLLKRFNMSNFKPMSTPTGMTEKLKRQDDDELTNEQIYRSWLDL